MKRDKMWGLAEHIITFSQLVKSLINQIKQEEAFITWY